MCSELECGICYRNFNTGRRCPRELQCKHSFCESCLVTLSRRTVCKSEGTRVCSRQDERTIVCPLCRHITPVLDGKVGALRVDECVLERMVVAGVPEDNEETGENQDETETCPDTSPAEENTSTPRTGGGRFRRSLRRVWGKITGNAQQDQRRHCMTDGDLRDLALMSCYII